MSLYEKGEKVIVSFSNAVELMRTLTTMHGVTQKSGVNESSEVLSCIVVSVLISSTAFEKETITFSPFS